MIMTKRLFAVGLAGTLLTSVLALSTTGCGKIKQQKECGAIIGAINESVTKAKAVNPGTPAGMTQFATVYDELGAKLSKIDASDPDMKKALTDYQALCKDVSKAARDAAAGKASAKKDFDAAVKKESELTSRINATCMRQ